ncbi:MAG: YfiR family protein [Methylococcaceae bacterium]|nr:YfiR family protein [Methylococcaceae bacterium]
MKDAFLTRSFLSLMLLFFSNLASSDANLEYKIKAGYLYNFTKFITWPALKSPTFNLCILGSDPFGEVIDPIENKTAFNRAIKIVRLSEESFLSSSASQIDCHILYLGGVNDTPLILEKIRAYPKQADRLIVGDGGEAIANGEMINFINRDGKIKIQIDLQSVKQTDLKISAKLLEIAELFREPSHE